MITNDEGDRLSDASEQDLKFIDIENSNNGGETQSKACRLDSSNGEKIGWQKLSSLKSL
jgi:hypothetical protein